MSRQQAAPARPLYDRVEEIRIRNGADQLGIEWGDLVQGVPDITRQFGVEHLSRRDMRVLEDRLRWERGGIEAIVEGGEPTPLVDRHVELRDSARAEDDLADRPPTRQELEEITAEIRRLRKELDDVKAQQAERSTSQERRDLDMG
jgi:hypothetical protein